MIMRVFNRQTAMKHRTTALILFIFVFLCAFPAMAKPKKVDKAGKSFSPEQITLNNQAVEATDAKDFAKAEQLYIANLTLGEFDLTWLNLGRTYAKQGKCLEARDAYARVPASEKVVNKGKVVDLTEIYAQYTQELEEQCNAPVTFKCETPEMVVSIDGGAAFPCDAAQSYLIEPGMHTFIGSLPNGSSARVTASVTTEMIVEIELVTEKEVVEVERIVEVEENWQKKSRIYSITGWSLLGIGAAVVIGCAIGQVYIQSQYDRLDPHNAGRLYNHYYSSFIGTGVGAALALAGAGLLIADHIKYGSLNKTATETPASAGWFPSLVFSPGTAGMGLSIRC